jgi:predicted CXXCH cytochrome family protein
LFFLSDEFTVCTTCHKRHAKFSHPVGADAIDPRSKRDITCITCHDLMGSQYEFALRFDRKKELCIQCHASY